MWGRVTKNSHAGTDKRNKIKMKHSKLLPAGWAAGQAGKWTGNLDTWEEVAAPWTSFCILLWWSDKNSYTVSKQRFASSRNTLAK